MWKDRVNRVNSDLFSNLAGTILDQFQVVTIRVRDFMGFTVYVRSVCIMQYRKPKISSAASFAMTRRQRTQKFLNHNPQL